MSFPLILLLAMKLMVQQFMLLGNGRIVAVVGSVINKAQSLRESSRRGILFGTELHNLRELQDAEPVFQGSELTVIRNASSQVIAAQSPSPLPRMA